MDADAALKTSDDSTTSALNSGSLLSNMNSARTRYQTDLDAEQKDMQPAIDKYKETSSQPMPAIPDPKKAAAAPDAQQFQKDSQGMVGAIAALSALVGSRGRGRGTAALKAFAGGLTGIQKGDQQAFEDSYKTWKGNTDAMMEDNKLEMDKYKEIMENRQLTADEAFNQIKMVGYEHQNKLMMDSKDFEQQAAIYESAMKASIGAQVYIDKLDAKAKEQIAQQEKNQAEQDKRYEEWKNRPSSKKDAESWNEGLPIAGFIRGRGKEAEEHLQFVKDYADELSPESDRAQAVEDYNSANKAISSFGSGKQGDIVRSFNVAYQHADVLGDLAVALRNGDVQAINAGKQAYEQAFGSAAPTNFDAAKGILADEVNKAAIGGAGALDDRKQLRENIIRATSPEQINGALGVYKKLIVGQMQGMRHQYETATGRKDFDKLLLPNVRSDLNSTASSSTESSGGSTPDYSHLWSESE